MTASSDARDLYKSIILRNNMTRAYTRDRASTLAKILAAIGESDNNIGGLFGTNNFYGATVSPWDGFDKSAIDCARDGFFVDSATGKYLTVVGGNYGVYRPPASPFDDTLFAKIIPVLAWLPKTPMLVDYRLAEAIFGTQASLGANAWQFYEVNANEIIFEVPQALIAATQANASYMHGYPGHAIATGGPTNTITSVGTNASLAASTLVGLSIYVFIAGAWVTYTINAQTYNAGTSTNTFTLSASTVPTGDYPFFIDIPASSAFPGDVMLPDATFPAGTPNPTSDLLVYLFGQGLLDIFTYYMNLVRAAGVVLRTVVI